jgi:hypothetical protein
MQGAAAETGVCRNPHRRFVRIALGDFLQVTCDKPTSCHSGAWGRFDLGILQFVQTPEAELIRLQDHFRSLTAFEINCENLA